MILIKVGTSKRDCSCYVGHVGSYEECAGDESSDDEPDQSDYDDCENVLPMAMGLVCCWDSRALLRIGIVWGVSSALPK